MEFLSASVVLLVVWWYTWIEFGGAVLIFILFLSLQELSLVNGVLFSGGSVKKCLYIDETGKVFPYSSLIRTSFRHLTSTL